MVVNSTSAAPLLGRLEEVARFLWFSKALGAGPGKTISIYSVTALCYERAGLSGKNPDPDGAIAWMDALGLGTVEAGHFNLSWAGERMLELTDSPLELSSDQKDFLLARSTQVSWLAPGFAALARWTRRDDSGRLLLSGGWKRDPDLTSCNEVAQQLGLLNLMNGQLVFNDSKLPLLGSLIEALPLAPEDLDRMLESQRRMAFQAELYLVEWEKARLRALGTPELASTVLHVARFDAGRGYDVRSVDGGDSGEVERFIEVKSSAGSNLEFYVSAHEIKVGETLAERYWIYFLPHAMNLPKSPARPIMIQDPFGRTRSAFRLAPMSFRVELEFGIRMDHDDVPATGLLPGIQISIGRSPTTVVT